LEKLFTVDRKLKSHCSGITTQRKPGMAGNNCFTTLTFKDLLPFSNLAAFYG